MKLRHLTIALALLVPATASAGPLQPDAALSNETADLTPPYEAPLTGSQPLSFQIASAPITTSQYTYETKFHVFLSNFVPNNNGQNNQDEDKPRQTPPGQDQVHPVPEPSTLLLVGSSLALAAVRKARAGRKQTATIQ
jgi:hypothetical protein